jgi:hypothetical protein
MDTNPQQDPLRALFSELRQSDERRAPRFQDDWEEAMARRQDRETIAWGRLAATVVVVALGATLAVTLRARQHHIAVAKQFRAPIPAAPAQPRPVEWAVADSITDWQSPTAFLLAAPTDTAWPGDSGDDAADETTPAHSDPRHL